MDQIEYQHQQQALTHYYYNSIHNQLLKKVTKFLLSISVFSFCFSYFSLFSLLHSFNFYFSTFPYQLFTHAIDKNWIFLICNLLLVVLTKCSGLIKSPSPSRSCRFNAETSFNTIKGGSEFVSPLLEREEPVLQREEIKVGSVGSAQNVRAEEEKGSEVLINQVEKDAEKTVKEYNEHEQVEPKFGFIVSAEEEEEEEGKGIVLSEEDEEGNGRFSCSTEELNKKFEDFIRKMKEEIRIEAQRQLIMV